jgi:hypothetical protein
METPVNTNSCLFGLTAEEANRRWQLLSNEGREEILNRVCRSTDELGEKAKNPNFGDLSSVFSEHEVAMVARVLSGDGLYNDFQYAVDFNRPKSFKPDDMLLTTLEDMMKRGYSIKYFPEPVPEQYPYWNHGIFTAAFKISPFQIRDHCSGRTLEELAVNWRAARLKEAEVQKKTS